MTTKDKVIKEFTLPSGVQVIMRKGTMRDILEATKVANGIQEHVSVALLARLCLFDGATKVMEDIMDMDMEDSLILLQSVGEYMAPEKNK